MLSALINQLEQSVAQLEADGPVAADSARLDISTHSKSGYEYARLRDGDSLTACGRVGSEKYLEVLAKIQRRDKIKHLRKGIAALKQADEIPIKLSATTLIQAPAPTQKPAANSKAKSAAPARKKKSGRKKLYTHVKTRRGSVTHAVLGKDKSGPWHTPALCGATPPKRDYMGWEFPYMDEGITCDKCYRNLPANSKRYIPDFG